MLLFSSFKNSSSKVLLIFIYFTASLFSLHASAQLPVKVAKAIVRSAMIERPFLPFLLNPKNKKEAFLRVVAKSQESLPEVDTSIKQLFICFEKSDDPIHSEECSAEIQELIMYYLFELSGNPHSKFSEKENSEAASFIKMNPEVVLRKDMNFGTFIRMTSSGRVGMLKDEVRNLDPNIFDQLESKSSLLVSFGSFMGSYLQLFPNKAEAVSDQTIFAEDASLGNGVRLIFKSDILTRFDYHLSFGWPGGQFIEGLSFTPYETDDFFIKLQGLYKDPKSVPDLYGTRGIKITNEVVFKNPISFSEVETIYVRSGYMKLARELLNQNGYPQIQVRSQSDSPSEIKVYPVLSDRTNTMISEALKKYAKMISNLESPKANIELVKKQATERRCSPIGDLQLEELVEKSLGNVLRFKSLL